MSYLSKVSTSTLLYSCLLYMTVFIWSLPSAGVKWMSFQILLILALVGLFGLIVYLRSEFDLLFIRIEGQNATRLGLLVIVCSVISSILYYLSLWI